MECFRKGVGEDIVEYIQGARTRRKRGIAGKQQILLRMEGPSQLLNRLRMDIDFTLEVKLMPITVSRFALRASRLMLALFIVVEHFTCAAFAQTSARGDWWMFHHDLQHTGRSPFTGPTGPALKWQYTTGGAINLSSPALAADGTIYLGADDNRLYAINSSNGALKWSYATGGEIETYPAIGADGTIYVGSRSPHPRVRMAPSTRIPRRR